MAQITNVTELTPSGVRLGNMYLKLFAVVVANANAANEWVNTGLAKIVGTLGAPALMGTTPPTDTPAAPVAATATLDMTGDTPTDTDTVTIDGIVYTLLATIGTARNNVLVNATPATQATNLANAINGVGTPGTQYTLDTPPHPTFSAAAVGDTVVLTHRVPGTVGNGKTCSTDITGATLANSAGGVDAGVVAVGASVVRNAQGTGQAEDSTMGALGLEASVAGTYLVAVYGRP